MMGKYVNKADMTCKICVGGRLTLIHIGTRDRSDINVYECCLCKTKQLDTFGFNDYEKGFMNGTTDMSESEIEEQNAFFDYITLFYVFEHLENPLYWLEKISFLFKRKWESNH